MGQTKRQMDGRTDGRQIGALRLSLNAGSVKTVMKRHRSHTLVELKTHTIKRKFIHTWWTIVNEYETAKPALIRNLVIYEILRDIVLFEAIANCLRRRPKWLWPWCAMCTGLLHAIVSFLLALSLSFVYLLIYVHCYLI